MKSKILLLVKTPPPITGATLMNSYVIGSRLLNEEFQIKAIQVTYKEKIEDISIISINKIRVLLLTFMILVKYIILFRPQVVYFQLSHLGWAFYRDCIYVFIIKIFRKHIVYHLHGKGIREYVANSKIKKYIYKWALRSSSIICLSESLTSDLIGVYDKKIYIVNNAIPVVPSMKKSVIKESNTILVLFLSNLIISKGIYPFLDSIFLINQKHKGIVNAWIVGKEVEISAENLYSEIEKRRITEVVRYLGPKYNEEKNNVFQNADIFIYPTCNDVWGLAILEAMQAGLPVIATMEGAIPEIVDDGITGFIVEKNNPGAIAEKIEYLINRQDVRMEMGKAGKRKFFEKYTLEIFESNMKNVFDDVLKKKQGYTIPVSFS